MNDYDYIISTNSVFHIKMAQIISKSSILRIPNYAIKVKT